MKNIIFIVIALFAITFNTEAKSVKTPSLLAKARAFAIDNNNITHPKNLAMVNAICFGLQKELGKKTRFVIKIDGELFIEVDKASKYPSFTAVYKSGKVKNTSKSLFNPDSVWQVDIMYKALKRVTRP